MIKNRLGSLTFVQNKLNQKLLNDFRNNVEKYFSLVDYMCDREILDSEESKPIRVELNKRLAPVKKAIQTAGEPTDVIYTNPPALGGSRQAIDLVDNIFLYQHYDGLSHHALTDLIDQALGAYEDDFFWSVFRTFNPFFWIKKVLEFVASMPFEVLGSLGFNKAKIESSRAGMIIKWLIEVITLLTTLWQAGIFLGWVPADKSVFKVIEPLFTLF